MTKRIITISREFGSGGRFIGEEVAKKLGIAYYDKNTKTLYFEFDYYSWASGQTEHCIRTLVFAE